MATSSHLFSSISRGGTQWVYGGRLFVVSARTNKRLALTSLGVPGRPLGNPPVVGFNLGHGGVPRGRSVDGQLSDTPLRAGLTRLTLCVPVVVTLTLCVPVVVTHPSKYHPSARSTPPGQVKLRDLKDRTDLKDVCTDD